MWWDGQCNYPNWGTLLQMACVGSRRDENLKLYLSPLNDVHNFSTSKKKDD